MSLWAYIVTYKGLFYHLTLTKNDTLSSDFLKYYHYNTTSYFVQNLVLTQVFLESFIIQLSVTPTHVK